MNLYASFETFPFEKVSAKFSALSWHIEYSQSFCFGFYCTFTGALDQKLERFV